MTNILVYYAAVFILLLGALAMVSGCTPGPVRVIVPIEPKPRVVIPVVLPRVGPVLHPIRYKPNKYRKYRHVTKPRRHYKQPRRHYKQPKKHRRVPTRTHRRAQSQGDIAQRLSEVGSHASQSATKIAFQNAYVPSYSKPRHLRGAPGYKPRAPRYRPPPVQRPRYNPRPYRPKPYNPRPYVTPATPAVPVAVPYVHPYYRQPNYEGGERIRCQFTNSSASAGKVTVKVVFFHPRPLGSSVRRVKWQYLTIQPNSTRIVSFSLPADGPHSSHEVKVHDKGITYTCG